MVTYKHTHTTHFRANAPSLPSSKKKKSRTICPTQKKNNNNNNKEISEAMDETFPIYNTLPQTFLM
jgi:hypothetical protein